MSTFPGPPERELTEAEAEAMSRYLAGVLDASERAGIEERLLQDPALVRELYRQQGIAAAVEAAARSRAANPRGAWTVRMTRRPVLLAAAAFVVVAGVVMLAGPRRDRMRGPVSGVRLIGPVGAVDAPPTEFRWSRELRAAQYRFELSDDAGRSIFATLTTDTIIRPSFADVPGGAPHAGSWRVVPLTTGGLELPAPPAASFGAR